MNKSVLITGGSRGIGRKLVELFSKKDYKVFFTYLNSEREAIELENSFGAKGFKVDFSILSDVASFSEMFVTEFGCPDVLVNNAGVSHYGLFQDTTFEEYEKVFNINFHASFFLTKALISHMISRKSGSIINISSVWGQCGASCEVLYSATKAAMIGFTKALAKELALSNISVNCVAPGIVDTDMMARFSEEEKNEMALDIPSGRFTKPEEVASLVLHLAEQSSSALTGQVIGINGGMLC